MDTLPLSVIWDAPEHHHIEKSNDWFWVLGIVGIAGASASFIFGNILFGIVIVLATITMTLVARHEPKIMEFEVSTRGIRSGSSLYLFNTLESYAIDYECGHGPQLIAKSKQLFMPLIILPLPYDNLELIDNILASNLPSEHLEEPLSHKILELFGF
jgi:hypothetical protein